MNTDFIFEPVPNKEAIAFIAGKPVVSQRVFKNLLPELKARAFTISGVESFNVLQTVRNKLSALPAGGDWEKIKRDIAADLGPWFVDKDADADEQQKQHAAAEAKAELLLRTHGNQAYAAASWQVLDRQRDALPYWQYLTMGDGHVREEHAALNGLTLPADSPFWAEHYPPWDWGCRCQVAAITREEYADIQAADADRAPDQRLAPTGAALAQIEQSNRLVRGPNQIFNLTPPSQRADGGGYRFNPRDLTLTAEQLKGCYDAETWNEFEKFARQTNLPADAEAGADAHPDAAADSGKNLWDWLAGGQDAPAAATAAWAPQKPVSGALQIATASGQKAVLRETLAAIDSVHDDGQLPNIKINGRAGRNNLGSYRFNLGGEAIGIGIKPGEHQPLTLAHEIGHFIDHQVLGNRGIFASDKNPAMKPWLDAVLNSEAFKQIETSKLPAKWKNYLSGRDELWARSYAQYIAEKSGHPAMLKNLSQIKDDSNWLCSQWTTDDFAPIKKAIDEIFKTKGWLP